VIWRSLLLREFRHSNVSGGIALGSEPASSSAIPALDFLRVTRLMRLLRIFHFIQGPTPETHDIDTHILRISITFISVMFCFAGIFMAVERGYANDKDVVSFHNAAYFVIVTMASVSWLCAVLYFLLTVRWCQRWQEVLASEVQLVL
jgi:hypothetical protein